MTAKRRPRMATPMPAPDVVEVVPPAPPPLPPVPQRLLVEVVVSHDDRRRGDQLELVPTPHEQRLIDRGYLRVVGTLDAAVPPFVATYPPGRP